MLIPIIVSDAAVNIAPDLDQKRDIVQNAITPCQLWGFQAAILEDAKLKPVDMAQTTIPCPRDRLRLDQPEARSIVETWVSSASR